MEITEKYFVKHESKETKPGCWNVLDVKIFEKLEDGTEKEIGGYTRNYSCFYKTFVPFKQKGKEYALISRDYTCLEVIELPSCKTIASETPHSFGFCPTEFYVPSKKTRSESQIDGAFGFVAGCVWGDDHSWKIEPIDLRRISEGKVERMGSLGYFEMPKCKDYNSIEKCIDNISFERREYEGVEKEYCYISMTGTKEYGIFHDEIARKMINKEEVINSITYGLIIGGLIPKEKGKELKDCLMLYKHYIVDEIKPEEDP